MHFKILCFLLISVLNKCLGSEESSSIGEHKSIDNVLNNSSRSPVTISRADEDFIYILRCENNEPVIWSCQNFNMSTQKSYISKGLKLKFGITLTILGTSAFKKNRCLCYKNSTTDKNLAEDELVSSIFVHELDDKNSVSAGSLFRLGCNLESKTKAVYQNLFRFKWILPKGLQWDKSRMSQFTLPIGKYDSILTIRDVVTKDSGDYTCQIVSFTLQSDSPEVDTPFKSIYAMAVKNIDDYSEIINKYNYDYLNFKNNSIARIGVCYSGYGLELNPEWYDPDDMKIVNNQKYYIKNDNDCSILNIYNARLLDSGTYVALDTHLLNFNQRYFNLTIEDVPKVSVENVFLRTNEKASIQCKVQAHPKPLVTWTFEPCIAWRLCSEELIEIISNITSSQGATSTIFIYTLTFMPISSGIIRCKAVNTIGTGIDQGHVIIRNTNDNMTIYGTVDGDVVKLGDNVTITCAVFAFYFSNSIHWYDRSGLLINETENIAISTALNSYYYTKSLNFKRITKSDRGQYECRAQLRNSTITKSITKIIIPVDSTSYRTTWIAGISLFIAVLFALVIYLLIRAKRERKLLDELKAAGLADFEEGDLGQINPSLTFDEQADLLPYDRRFEFPRDKIKLGMQLGAGAFGVVFKAYAEGIKPNEIKSVVAVKMVKRDAHNDVIKALVSELKIMVHLGRHLNVVNLLGAVTKNISKRELMVIVEYCHYGNARSFLLSYRERFINQIDPITGKIDTSAIIQKCLYQNVLNQNSEDTNSGCSHLTDVGMTQKISNESQAMIELKNVSGGVIGIKEELIHRFKIILAGIYCNTAIDTNKFHIFCMDTAKLFVDLYGWYYMPVTVHKILVHGSKIIEESILPIDEDDSGLSSNNYINQGQYSNFKLDITEDIVVTTADLISWSYQLASGMEYLSSMNVLHGDLAARNILLSKGYIVKICDFGLARSMYESDNYKKKDGAVLPVKWLALESLSDHIFSTYTDVWSFGVVLWELFSLATIPYPDVHSYQKLYEMLKNGYRMEKPPYANDDIYYIMLECWSLNPKARPLFHVLKEKFAAILGKEVSDHYVAMNEPYLKANNQHPNLKMYLSTVGPSGELAPLPPKYVNITTEMHLSPNDYLPMTSNSPAKESSKNENLYV